MQVIDLRSDTVTKPTPAMRRAMAEAEVGDDDYGEDPTVNALEELGAAMTGKEAALFVTSGTQGNQVAIYAHTSRGSEVICDAESHVFWYENAGPAVLSGVQLRPVANLHSKDAATLAMNAIRESDIHVPVTRLITLENTLNRAGGTVLPYERVAELCGFAHTRGVAVHLDGARIFNAATAMGCDVREFTVPVDSVMFCLSKGLGAPIGSLLAGSREFITRARKVRKLFGGGLRQAGIVAAAGIIALREMTGRLGEDHVNARRLAEGLDSLPGLEVDMSKVQTNMVLADFAGTGLTGDEFVSRLKANGVLTSTFGPTVARFVTHKDVAAADIPDALERVRQALA